jgi:hypothetical protein
MGIMHAPLSGGVSERGLRCGFSFPSVRDSSVTPIMRLYGEDFLVNETLWTGEITDVHWCLCDGKSGHASFRLLRVFEFAADGKIKSEKVWVDLAAIQQQLS